MKINLIIPMAGRGSRFSEEGYSMPKPLIELHGRPFFWWAIESVVRSIENVQIICVVLQEHIELFSIDEKIWEYYPQAKIVSVLSVTSGALETAMLGVVSLSNTSPIIINDCDHAFVKHSIKNDLEFLFWPDGVDAALCHFRANSSQYSYALYDNNYLIETREKEAISDLAIAGAYIFKSKEVLLDSYEEYLNSCPYTELFISGLYNIFIQNGLKVSPLLLDNHISFGTPREMALALKKFPFLNWKK